MSVVVVVCCTVLHTKNCGDKGRATASSAGTIAIRTFFFRRNDEKKRVRIVIFCANSSPQESAILANVAKTLVLDDLSKANAINGCPNRCCRPPTFRQSEKSRIYLLPSLATYTHHLLLAVLTY